MVEVPGHEGCIESPLAHSPESNSLPGRRRSWGGGERSHDTFADRAEAAETSAWSEAMRDERLMSEVLTGDREKRPGGGEEGFSDSLAPFLLIRRGLHTTETPCLLS